MSKQGAGTILDSLKNNLKVIAFVNEGLKDNHQVELVAAMIDQGYIHGFLSLGDFATDKVILEARGVPDPQVQGNSEAICIPEKLYFGQGDR